ncbi:unnamed protein product, partial [Porites lobata]
MEFHHWISFNGVLQNVVFLSQLKYLKRRIMYSYGHPGSFNPAVITNKEAHMIYGNMNKEAGSSQATGLPACKKSCQPIADKLT